jgi:choline dehydrogenase-like flavoprotein
VHARLLYPSDARIALHMVVEQEPRRSNRISLSELTDPYGSPLARIDWEVGQADRDALLEMSRLFQAAWRETNAALGEIVLKPSDDVDAAFAGNGGIYHPGGTTRIGRSAASGALDRDFRAFGIPNLTVVATSAFPTGGGANPTMMLILATLRAADRISAELG